MRWCCPRPFWARGTTHYTSTFANTRVGIGQAVKRCIVILKSVAVSLLGIGIWNINGILYHSIIPCSRVEFEGVLQPNCSDVPLSIFNLVTVMIGVLQCIVAYALALALAHAVDWEAAVYTPLQMQIVA